MLVGDIGRPQGLQGEVRIRSFTAEPASIAEYGPLEDESGTRLFEIESLRVTPKALSARIKGVTTREEAEALTGTKLYVPRTRLPAREVRLLSFLVRLQELALGEAPAKGVEPVLARTPSFELARDSVHALLELLFALRQLALALSHL